MEQIKKIAQEAVSTLTSGKENSVQKRNKPDWFPVQLYDEYEKTNLTYKFCIHLFAKIEANKREKIPEETARSWFIEFVRRGWTQKMLQQRYDALLSTKIYGIEKLEIADWINAVETFDRDEVNLMINRKIDSMIVRGNFLKDKKVELTEEDKKCIDLAEAKRIEQNFRNGIYEERENYRQERRRFWKEKFKQSNKVVDSVLNAPGQYEN